MRKYYGSITYLAFGYETQHLTLHLSVGGEEIVLEFPPSKAVMLMQQFPKVGEILEVEQEGEDVGEVVRFRLIRTA